MTDKRILAGIIGKWFDRFDEATMTAIVEFENDEGEEIEVPILCEYAVCSVCDGKGKFINPSIDSHGITRGEWMEDFDDDSRAGYLGGRYDVTCDNCGGARVTPKPLSINRQRDPNLAIEALKHVDRLLRYGRESAHECEMGY